MRQCTIRIRMVALVNKEIMENRLLLGDCLDVMKGMDTGSIDLIYSDPPYNTGVDWGEFNDEWSPDDVKGEWLVELEAAHPSITLLIKIIMREKGLGAWSYMAMILVRLFEMRRILKDSGSTYIHVDQGMSHYVKLGMDIIFGRHKFQNEIIWAYRTGGVSKSRFARKHDNIFFYTKTDKYTFNESREKSYVSATSAGMKAYGHKGKEYMLLEDEGGVYRQVVMRDVWHIDATGTVSHERLGYPTQKPLELLKRIVAASSNEGDVVLDPFCGSGTTLLAAQSMNRRWIGIDKNPNAIRIAESRLHQRTLL